jgi:hypothetical protein
MIDKSIVIEVHEDEVKDFMNDLRFLFSKEELSVSPFTEMVMIFSRK